MRVTAMVLAAVGIASGAWAAGVPVLTESFDDYTVGRLESGAEFSPGRDGKALKLGPEARVVYPGVEFPRDKGRIELDLCPYSPIRVREDRKHWMLLSDVGAGAAWQGATVIYFDRDTAELGYGVFNGAWQWIWARGVDWEVGRWRQLSFTWGPEGRDLALDGVVVAHDDYAGGLDPRTMQIGYFDGYSVAAPVLVDNFAVIGDLVDSVRLERGVVCPAQDGLLDSVDVTWTVASPANAQIGLFRGDTEVARMLGPVEAEAGKRVTPFTAAGVPSGRYELRMTLSRAGGTEVKTAALSVDSDLRWAAAPPRWDNTFPLGVWYFWEDDASYINRFTEDEQKAAAYYDETLADLASLGVDTVIANWTPRAHRMTMLDAAQRHGIRVIVHLDEVNGFIWSPEKLRTEDFVSTIRDAVATASNHPATAGYYLVDEPAPTPENIANIKLCRQLVEALDPEHPGFSCLNTGWEVIFPAVGYEVLLVDIYPVYSARLEGDVLRGYIGAVDRAYAAANGSTLWVIPQCFGFKPRPGSIPAPNEVTLMCWEAIAHGARGLIHFIYQSTTGVQGEWLRGIVDEDLKPMDHRYEEVRRLHASIAPLRSTLLGLTRLPECPAVVGDGFDVQAFSDAAGKRYLVVVNQDTHAPQTAEISFTDAARPSIAAVEDVATGERLGDGNGARCTLEPGTGKLLRLAE